MKNNLLKLFMAIGLFVSGCASYKPMPLDPVQEWVKLERISLKSLIIEPQKGEMYSATAPPFDYSDGLSVDEAAGVAVVLNPELRAFRHKQGIAQAQLVGAGLLPNPEIDTTWLIGSEFWTGEIGVLFNLTEALMTRGPKREGARIRIEEVRWEIADREWQLVNNVAHTFLDVLYWDEAIKLNHTQKELTEQTLAGIKAAKAQGAGTELDIIMAESEVTDIERQEKRFAGKRKRAMQALNKLLGLPPDHNTHLQKQSNPLAYQPITGDVDMMAKKIKERLPEILAAQKSYDVAEKWLQVAYRKQFPHISFGPSYGKEDAGNFFGIGFFLEAPFFNWNQGEIALRLAERDQKRQEYAAKLHNARAKLYASWTELKTLADELEFYFSNIASRLEHGLELTQKAFKEGEIELLKVLLFQRKVIESKREIMQLLRKFYHARIELKKAAGPTIDIRNDESANLNDLNGIKVE